MVFGDEDQCDGKLHCDEKRGPVAVAQEAGKQRKARRTQNRRQRNVAADRQHHDEHCDGRQRGPWRCHQENAKARGHALAALEAEPHREDVPQHGHQRGQRLHVGRRNAGSEQSA